MKPSIPQFWTKKPLIISGPCSAESEFQVLDTARQLALTGKVDIFRAGIWKPRTRPGTFEGVGDVGLPWLRAVKEETGLPVTVEVAKAIHIELALKHGVDVLWIGARTTVNPFSVQELADALRGVDIPVLVKNPINADTELWIGALERILKSGIKQAGLIHRGFSTYANSEYRNPPMWQIPIEMKRRFPDIPLLCDPSHICGNRYLLKDIAQKSIDLGFSGLMVESHFDPDNAWSDAAQQLKPQDFVQMMDALVWRCEQLPEADTHAELTALRGFIDQLDEELVNLLGQRMKIIDKIGVYKKNNNLTILQTKRWNEILKRGFARGEELQLTRDFLARYFNAIHLESIHHQNEVMNRDAENENELNQSEKDIRHVND
jgi:chorismate mutase